MIDAVDKRNHTALVGSTASGLSSGKRRGRQILDAPRCGSVLPKPSGTGSSAHCMLNGQRAHHQKILGS
jgi:hypothetical protein